MLVIFCAGAVSQLETWDYKPELIKHDGQPLPGGPAVTFQGPAGNLARPQYALPAARPDRQDGLRHAPAPRRTDRRHRLHSLADQQEQHPRPGRELPLHRLRPRRIPQPGLLGHLCARQREPGPARLRRDPRPARRAAERLEQLGARLPPRRVPGHAAQRQGPGPPPGPARSLRSMPTAPRAASCSG